MSDEIYETLLYDGAKVKSVASFLAGALRPHHHRPRPREGLFDDRLAVGFLAAPNRSPRRLTPCKATAPAIDVIRAKGRRRSPQRRRIICRSGSRYDKRRRYAHAKLNSIPGLTCVNAKGAFYLFPNISKTGLKSAEFCAKLLEQEKVAAVPGIAFGADDYIRLSYATSMANMKKVWLGLRNSARRW